MTSSSVQRGPRTNEQDGHSATVLDPSTETFLSPSALEKPIHSPSGEKNGPLAPSVPGIGLASRASSDRTKSFALCPSRAA